MAAPAGNFPLFDNGQQKEDGTYARESHTLISIGSRNPPLRPSHPPQPTCTTTPWRRRIDITLSAGHFALLQSSSNNRIASNPGNATRSRRRRPHPPPPPPSPPQSLLLVNLTHPPPLSLHPPFDVRANRVERSTYHQQNQRVPHNRHKSHRITKHAQTHTHSTVRPLARQEQHEAFLFYFVNLQPYYYPRLTLALPLSSSNSGPGSLSRLFFPLPTTVSAFIFYLENDSAFSSFVDLRRIVPTHATVYRDAHQSILLLCFIFKKSKYHHGGNRTQGQPLDHRGDR